MLSFEVEPKDCTLNGCVYVLSNHLKLLIFLYEVIDLKKFDVIICQPCSAHNRSQQQYQIEFDSGYGTRRV